MPHMRAELLDLCGLREEEAVFTHRVVAVPKIPGGEVHTSDEQQACSSAQAPAMGQQEHEHAPQAHEVECRQKFDVEWHRLQEESVVR